MLILVKTIVGLPLDDFADLDLLKQRMKEVIEQSNLVTARVRTIEVDFTPDIGSVDDELAFSLDEQNAHTTPDSYLLDHPETEIAFDLVLRIDLSDFHMAQSVADYVKTQLLVKLNLVHGSNNTDVFYSIDSSTKPLVCRFNIVMHLDFAIADTNKERNLIKKQVDEVIKAEKIYIISFIITLQMHLEG